MTRDRGVGEDRGSSGAIRGRRSIWALEGSFVTFLHVLHPPHPKGTTTPQLPPSPSHPLRSLRKLHLKLPLLQLEKLNWHLKSPHQLLHQLWRWLSLPTLHPFAFSWGHQKGLYVPGGRGEVRGHQPHMPLSVYMCAGTI